MPAQTAHVGEALAEGRYVRAVAGIVREDRGHRVVEPDQAAWSRNRLNKIAVAVLVIDATSQR